MNLRLFSVALLISAFPALVSAGEVISLDKGDFIAAERITPDGETVVSVKLSKSGKSKFKKLNEHFVGQEVRADIGGVTSTFKLREPIRGDSLEMGPYSAEEATKVIAEIGESK